MSSRLILSPPSCIFCFAFFLLLLRMRLNLYDSMTRLFLMPGLQQSMHQNSFPPSLSPLPPRWHVKESAQREWTNERMNPSQVRTPLQWGLVWVIRSKQVRAVEGLGKITLPKKPQHLQCAARFTAALLFRLNLFIPSCKGRLIKRARNTNHVGGS